MSPFSEGQWIQWITEHHYKRGEIILSKGVSIVVRWLDGEEQVFPNIEYYLESTPARMVAIGRPREASRLERESRKGIMSVTRAAASLGVSPKRIRAMLRSGQLQGTQEGGKWVSVIL